MRYLPSARERTQVVHAWINQIIVERMCLEPYAMDTSDTSMRSRVTAYLSDAMDAYEQCKCVLLGFRNVLADLVPSSMGRPCITLFW